MNSIRNFQQYFLLRRRVQRAFNHWSTRVQVTAPQQSQPHGQYTPAAPSLAFFWHSVWRPLVLPRIAAPTITTSYPHGRPANVLAWHPPSQQGPTPSLPPPSYLPEAPFPSSPPGSRPLLPQPTTTSTPPSSSPARGPLAASRASPQSSPRSVPFPLPHAEDRAAAASRDLLPSHSLTVSDVRDEHGQAPHPVSLGNGRHGGGSGPGDAPFSSAPETWPSSTEPIRTTPIGRSLRPSWGALMFYWAVLLPFTLISISH